MNTTFTWALPKTNFSNKKIKKSEFIDSLGAGSHNFVCYGNWEAPASGKCALFLKNLQGAELELSPLYYSRGEIPVPRPVMNFKLFKNLI